MIREEGHELACLLGVAGRAVWGLPFSPSFMFRFLHVLPPFLLLAFSPDLARLPRQGQGKLTTVSSVVKRADAAELAQSLFGTEKGHCQPSNFFSCFPLLPCFHPLVFRVGAAGPAWGRSGSRSRQQW